MMYLSIISIYNNQRKCIFKIKYCAPTNKGLYLIPKTKPWFWSDVLDAHPLINTCISNMHIVYKVKLEGTGFAKHKYLLQYFSFCFPWYLIIIMGEKIKSMGGYLWKIGMVVPNGILFFEKLLKIKLGNMPSNLH
jgi:hypothetical protein